MTPATSMKGIIAILMALLLSNGATAQTLAKAPGMVWGFHVFFRTGWTTPYIHYKTGSGWTTSPGYAMTKSNDSTNYPAALGWFRYDFPASTTSLEFVFNNGNGIWDNNGNANYKVTIAGTWQITSSVSTPPSATVLTAASDGLQVFFQTGWTASYIHYSSGSTWTTSPGKLMTASTVSTYPASVGWFQYNLAAPQASLEFVFNNSNDVWDNNNNANYKATSSGRWIAMSTVSLRPVTKTTTPTPTNPASMTRSPSPTMLAQRPPQLALHQHQPVHAYRQLQHLFLLEAAIITMASIPAPVQRKRSLPPWTIKGSGKPHHAMLAVGPLNTKTTDR